MQASTGSSTKSSMCEVASSGSRKCRLLTALEMRRCTSFYVESQHGKFMFYAALPQDEDRSLSLLLFSFPNQCTHVFTRSICVAIASSSKFLRQQLSNAMVDFSMPLRIIDHTAPDEDFPELIKFDDVARGHNADGGPGSALLVKGLVAVRALRDFCCNNSKGGESIVLRACCPFVGGMLRRADIKFHSGKYPL